jgi:hypothetical protein
MLNKQHTRTEMLSYPQGKLSRLDCIHIKVQSGKN